MKKILILGANGFIGSNLVDFFSQSGCFEVYGIYHKNKDKYNEKCAYLAYDLTDSEDVERCFSLIKPDYVVNGAAYTTSSKDVIESPWKHITINSALNPLVFEACHTHKVKHCIWFSCSTPYQSSPLAKRETEVSLGNKVPKPYEMVATMKLYCEELAALYSDLGNCKYTSIRLSNVIGKNDKLDGRGHFFISTVKKICDADNKITVWGPSEPARQAKRDFVAVEDVCSMVDGVLDKQDTAYGLFNCGYGISYTISEVVDLIKKVAGKDDLEVVYDETKPSIPTDTSLDCSKALKLLDWRPEVSFEEGIRRTVEWYKENH